MTSLRRLLIFVVAFTAWQALSGCSEASDQSRLAQARELMAQKDSAGAVLQLKSVLQTSPADGEARRLLGQALLATGHEYAAAEVELMRALDLGESVDDVLPDLALSLMAQRKEAQLLITYGKTRLSQVGPAATFLTLLAEAQAIKGSLPDARRLLAEALVLQPEHVAARLMEARLSAAGGDTALAMKQVDALLARRADDPDVWMFKADLVRAGGADASAVLAAYRQVLAVRPDALAAHTALMSSMIRRGDFDSARQQFQAMAKVLPEQPQTMLFEALLAQQRGDDAQARDLAQRLVRRLPDDPLVLLLAGQTELRAGALGQAEALLAKAVRVSPQAPAARRLLAQLQLRAGQADRALLTLKPLTGNVNPDPDALLLAAQAAQQKGHLADAERDFLRAEQLRPGDKRIPLARTLARFGSGQDDAALVELQALADAETTGTEAAMATISAHLVRKEYDAALKAVGKLAAGLPKSPMPDVLRGHIALQRQDPAQARRHFEKALALDERDFPAVLMLTSLDLDDKQPEQALARLDALLTRRPMNLEAMLAKIEIKARGGAPGAEVRALLDELVRSHPTEAVAHLARIDYLRGVGESAQALVAAQAAAAAVPNQVTLLDRLGLTQRDSGALASAETTFRRLISLQPEQALPQLRLAEVQLLRNQPEAARSSIQRARELDAGDVDALRAALALALRDGRPAEAIVLAREMQTRRPREPIGWLLEGDVEASRQRWGEAQIAYRRALSMAAQSSEAAQRLHAALFEGGQLAEADELAAQWQAGHPGDIAFLHHRASASLARKDWAQAETLYRGLLERAPDDVVVLNNLAVALTHQNKPGAAALAEKAAQLAPTRPEIQDTLALIHAQGQQIDLAIESQRKAVELAPKSVDMRLGLAKLYVKAGDKDRARFELAVLDKLDRGLAGRDEVQRLHQLLGPAPASRLVALAQSGRLAEFRRFLSGAQSTAKSAVTVLGLGLLLASLLAALRPAVFLVRRAIVVNAPAQQVFDLLQDLRQWERWSAWPQFSAAVAREFNPTTVGRGAYLTWRDKRRDVQGSVEILSLTAPDNLVVDLAFTRHDELHHVFEFTLSPDPSGGTLVQCVARGPAPFWLRLRSVLPSIDWRIGRPLQRNLARLKTAAEAVSDASRDPAQPAAVAAA
jgi:putative PEP-CTERM system TPR-repeat lipoprotein